MAGCTLFRIKATRLALVCSGCRLRTLGRRRHAPQDLPLHGLLDRMGLADELRVPAARAIQLVDLGGRVDRAVRVAEAGGSGELRVENHDDALAGQEFGFEDDPAARGGLCRRCSGSRGRSGVGLRIERLDRREQSGLAQMLEGPGVEGVEPPAQRVEGRPGNSARLERRLGQRHPGAEPGVVFRVQEAEGGSAHDHVPLLRGGVGWIPLGQIGRNPFLIGRTTPFHGRALPRPLKIR
jgi:hypothetical protein